jgi:hypothetical protein
VSGSTAGQTSGLAGGGSCGGSTSGEDVFTFELDELSDVTVSTALAGTSFNAALYLRTDCDDVATQLGCASQGSLGDALVLPRLEPGSYFAIVDGFSGAAGSYQIELTTRAIRAAGEACDPFGEASRCEDGLICQPVGSSGNAVCVDAAGCAAAAQPVTAAGAGANVQEGATSAASGYAPACAASGSGGEDFFHVTVGAAGGARDLVLDVSATGTLAPVAEWTSLCGVAASSQACTAGTGAGAALAVIENVSPGDYFGVVDGAAGTSGSYVADVFVRPVVAAGAPCDRALRENRCASGVCVDGFDLDSAPTCTTGVPVLADVGAGDDNDSCESASGPRSADFVFAGAIDADDADVIELAPSLLTTRLVVSVHAAGGTCPVDLALDLTHGACEGRGGGGGLSSIASSNDEGIGSCPYLDVPMQGGESYWLTVSRAGNQGSGAYTMVVDFIP